MNTGDRQKTVKKGHEAFLNGGTLQEAKFNGDMRNDLYMWSNLRSEYLSEASVASARTYVAGYRRLVMVAAGTGIRGLAPTRSCRATAFCIARSDGASFRPGTLATRPSTGAFTAAIMDTASGDIPVEASLACMQPRRSGRIKRRYGLPRRWRRFRRAALNASYRKGTRAPGS